MEDNTRVSRQGLLSIIRTIDPDFSSTLDIFSSFKNRKILVACSGGADSIALCAFFYAFELDCGIAYVDHAISGATAECEILVKEIAHIYDFPFYTASLRMAESYVLSSNVEAKAREFRYGALEKIRQTHSYDLIATAHHMDDYVETFLINLIRGTGSKGASLQLHNETIVRPLINWRKHDLEEVVKKCGLQFFLDPMNEDKRFVRNRIRHEVIPLLSEISRRDVTPLIARAAQHVANDNSFLDSYASAMWPKDQASTSDLKMLDTQLQVHALRVWIGGYPPTNDEMARILEVVHHERTSVQLSGNRTIWRRGGVLHQDRTDKYLKQEK